MDSVWMWLVGILTIVFFVSLVVYFGSAIIYAIWSTVERIRHDDKGSVNTDALWTIACLVVYVVMIVWFFSAATGR